MKRVIERTEQNTISVRIKNNKYYEARISLKIGGGKSERLQKGGKTQDLAVLQLLNEVEIFIDSIIRSGVLTFKINPNLPSLLIKSINTLHITNAEVSERTLQIVNKINNFNSQFDNIITINTNIIPFRTSQNNISIAPQPPYKDYEAEVLEKTKHDYKNNNTYSIEEVAISFKEYELKKCIKTDDNPKPLCQKTIDGYIKVWNDTIAPFLKKSKLLYIKQIDEEIIKSLLKNTNGYHVKRIVYIVLSLFYQYLKKEKIVESNIIKNIDKPVKPPKDDEEDIVCIAPEKQNEYLDKFEAENTDMSILFETMLLTGIRPEEACGLKWTALNLESNELIINNAYKDFKIYDENKNPIGHERRDDRLKNQQSYRRIPLTPRLREILLKHKERQKQIFKKSRAIKDKHKKWSESEYMFLGRTYKPYVSDTLSSAMPELCDKLELDRITPYVLRHSFATFCFEKGMQELVLMKLLGHSSLCCTRKYYICVTKKIKQREMDEVFKDVFSERKAS